MKLEITFELANEDTIDWDSSESMVDSLVQQLSEVVANAVEEKQIEIPGTEITDYGVGRHYEW